MSAEKYPSIFSRQMATIVYIFSSQMEAIVFIILQIFFATRAVLKIGEYSRIFPSFSWGIFRPVTRLGQSRAGKKISWIISKLIVFLPLRQGMFITYLFCCEPVVIRYNLSVFESTRHIAYDILIIQFIIFVKIVFKSFLVYEKYNW